MFLKYNQIFEVIQEIVIEFVVTFHNNLVDLNSIKNLSKICSII